MPSICFYFQVHQPLRIKRYRIFDVGVEKDYFNDDSDTSLNNAAVFKKVADKSYLPTNKVLLDLLKKHKEFKVSFSLSGIFMEQAQKYAPEVIESFKKLVDTGRAEILAETYYHSLSFLYSRSEFRKQVQLHKKKVIEIFGVKPKVFRNTELIFSNEVAFEAEGLGFEGILAEGADHILGWRSPNFLYRPKGTKKIKLLLKNYRLSDDIAFRFSSKEWGEYPLTAPKFADWVSQVNGNGQVVNLFMDYETFGEHQWEDTGIFEFLKHLPGEILKNPDNDFVTPSEAVKRYEPESEIDIPDFVSWADTERDLSAWLSNPMQHDALNKLFEMENPIFELDDPSLIDTWRRLTTSDHFYYMCTKWWNDGDVHKYFSPYDSPYDAFICFMNALADLRLRMENKKKGKDIAKKEFERMLLS